MALFMDGFCTSCDKEEVPTAVAIVEDPKMQGQPLIATRGRPYDVAVLLAKVLRQLKTQLGEELRV